MPGELSIVGFDNHETSEHLDIPLTMVAQDFYEIGRKAAEIVINQIEFGEMVSHKIEVGVTLIERQSFGALIMGICENG